MGEPCHIMIWVGCSGTTRDHKTGNTIIHIMIIWVNTVLLLGMIIITNTIIKVDIIIT